MNSALLAEIETPEVDQEVQARADPATAQANYDPARTTNERRKGLPSTEWSPQMPISAGDAAAKGRAPRRPPMSHAQELESPARGPLRQTAPVTRAHRALINAGQSAGNALFRVADTHRLRIYVSVPQPYASAVHDGLTAALVFADHPGKRYEAQVANTAHALDAASRTLQVELQIDNAKGEAARLVRAGSSHPDRRDNTLRVPVNTVLFRTDG